jgi:5-methylthioadenosine/S-adenosylhomocysteine deaminase
MDPTLTLAQNVVGHHVRSTIVDGRIVMKDREFLTVDIEKLRADVRQHYPRMIERYEKAIQLTSG